jgi:hypothetical protein
MRCMVQHIPHRLTFFSIFIRYLAHLHFQCYTKSPPYPPIPTPLPTHSPFLALAFPCTGAYKVCHLLIHMQLESRAPGYWLVHNVVPPIGLQIPLAPWVLSSSSIGSPVIHPLADCEHPLLCLLGPIVSQETATSGSFR